MMIPGRVHADALAAAEAGDFATAAQLFEKAAAQSPDDATLHEQRAQCLLEASNFFLSYISPETMVKNIFTLREPKDRSGILYMATFVGQHGFPWMVISGIYASGLYAVPKEYMLASTIASAFYALDITFRVTRVCEAQGVAKSNVIAGAPIYAIVGVLSFLVYQSM